jgi:ABC-type lipoprotein export system ATPase subunit
MTVIRRVWQVDTIREPGRALLLADEPCANLDTRNSTTILELIRKLNKDLNQTVVMGSHEDWHRKYFDRIIFLQDGKVVSEQNMDNKSL